MFNTEGTIFHNMIRIAPNIYIGDCDEHGAYDNSPESFYKTYKAVVMYNDEKDEYVGNCLVDPDLHWIEEMVIMRCYRNQGFGGRLLELAINIFGAEYVAPEIENVDGIRFYENHGFRQFSHEPLERGPKYPRVTTGIVQMRLSRR